MMEKGKEIQNNIEIKKKIIFLFFLDYKATNIIK